MKCPYCGKMTRDMPNHLVRAPGCQEKHRHNLVKQIDQILVLLAGKGD